MRSHTFVPALVIFAILNGNASAAAPPTIALIGNWEEDPGSCESGAFVSYRADGSSFGYDYEGRWTLKGTTLETTVTKRMGSDEQWRPLRKPERSATTIVFLTHDRMIERWSDGSLHRNHRCH